MARGVKRDRKAWFFAVLFLALYTMVCTIEARDIDARQPVRMVAR